MRERDVTTLKAEEREKKRVKEKERERERERERLFSNDRPLGAEWGPLFR